MKTEINQGQAVQVVKEPAYVKTENTGANAVQANYKTKE